MLFHIRLAIMFLLLDRLKLYGIQMFVDETLGWENPFTVENSDDIFTILQWKNNSLVIWVVKRMLDICSLVFLQVIRFLKLVVLPNVLFKKIKYMMTKTNALKGGISDTSNLFLTVQVRALPSCLGICVSDRSQSANSCL